MRVRPRPRPGKYDTGIKVLAIQYLQEGLTKLEVQHRLRSSVSVRTLSRWQSLYHRTSAVIRNPAEYETLGRNTRLTDEERDFMLTAVDENPTLYLDELREAIYRDTGKWVALSTVADDLKKRLSFSLKTTRTVHPNQSADQRARYLHAVGALQPEMMVFLDECAIQERSLRRIHGWARRGYRTKRMPWSRGGKRYTLLPAIFKGGVLAMACQEGSFLRRDFESFLKHQLFPVMNPYPQANSVLVMDNARIHHGGRIAEMAAEKGIRIIYLPPYSPDLNPIEKAFSVLKSHFRRIQSLARAAADAKIETIENTTWGTFTARLMHKLYAVCGYWM